MQGHELEVLQYPGHGRVQTTGDNLKRNQSSLTLAPFNIGDVSPVHIKANSHVRLGPALLFPQSAETHSDSNQKCMIFAGHPLIVAL